jgi:hypothetical protein
MCGSSEIVKRLSAPRLNFGAPHVLAERDVTALAAPSNAPDAVAQRLWLQASHFILLNTVDVGSGFAEAARKMHYGEAPPSAIRGQATVLQAQALVDEGIEVLPFMVPLAFSGTRH